MLTPPDVVSMLLLLVPLYGLYEFAILAIRIHALARCAACGAFELNGGRGGPDRRGPGSATGGGEGWRFRAHLIG